MTIDEARKIYDEDPDIHIDYSLYGRTPEIEICVDDKNHIYLDTTRLEAYLVLLKDEAEFGMLRRRLACH